MSAPSMPGYGDQPEEWRDIPGFEGRYQVSSLGRVKALQRPVRCTSHKGEEWRIARERILKASPAPTGHLYLALGRGNGRSVHRLVALAFIGPAPEGMDVAHLDGDPANNRPENLAYVTRQENNRHVTFHGRRLLSVEQVRYIREKAAEGLDAATRKQLAADVGLSVRHLGHILKGRTYGYVS